MMGGLLGRLTSRWRVRAASLPPFPTFDLSGWHERKRSDEQLVWTDDHGDSLLISRVPKGGGPAMSDVEGWRREGRSIAAERNGGIVSGDAVVAHGVPLFQLIYKRPDGNGFMYSAMLFMSQFVISLGAREPGVTGTREAAVTLELFQKGQLAIERDPSGATGKIRGWFADPYDPSYAGIVLRSISDDEIYDAAHPDHPLTRIRRTLTIIKDSLSVRP